jgi:nitrite reductase/ring-hydroxylating ferredoxin subunit/uncharacterized membrane protein
MLRALLNRLEQASSLDRAGDRLQDAVQATVRPRRLRDLLHGVWLGHPLHPVLVQLPVGAFASVAILDLLPGRSQRKAATALLAVGTASTLPAAAAGLNDWASLAREQRRVGLVHAVGNTVALGLYTASLVSRLRGSHGTGKVLAFAGLSFSGAAAYLGGHLSYKEGAGVNHAVPELRLVPEGWQRIATLAEVPEGRPVVRELGEVSVLLYRTGDSVTAMLEHCGHQGGPLGEGKVQGSGPDACVVCPWHGSVFRLTDGLVVHGPAATDQPLLVARVVDDTVEVRLP